MRNAWMRFRRQLSRWIYPEVWVTMELSTGPHGTKVWMDGVELLALKPHERETYARWSQRRTTP